MNSLVQIWLALAPWCLFLGACGIGYLLWDCCVRIDRLERHISKLIDLAVHLAEEKKPL